MGKRLWVERNKDGSWDAFGEDGAHIKFVDSSRRAT